MTKAWMFVAFLAAGTIMFADTVTSTTCNVYGLPTATDPHSCSLTIASGPFGDLATAQATVNASFSLAADASSFSTLEASLDAFANPFTPNGTPNPDGLSGAGSRVSVNETLYTSGNMRSGYVQISADGGYTRDLRNGAADMGLSLGPVLLSCVEGPAAGISTCVLFPDPQRDPPRYIIPPYPQYANQIEYPFILGTAFNFSYASSAGAGTGIAPGQFGSASSSLQFQFRFLEADGVTPVAVEAAPEPGTFAFFGVALGVLVIVKSKIQRLRPY